MEEVAVQFGKKFIDQDLSIVSKRGSLSNQQTLNSQVESPNNCRFTPYIHMIDTMTSDNTSTVVLDIESLTQPPDRSAGSPKMTRALSRKWSYRAERLATAEEEDMDEPSKKLLIKVNPQFEPLKQALITGKSTAPSTATTCSPNLIDDGRNKRFNRFMTINPKKILLIFATLSSVGTLILIYFTLAINKPSVI